MSNEHIDEKLVERNHKEYEARRDARRRRDAEEAAARKAWDLANPEAAAARDTAEKKHQDETLNWTCGKESAMRDMERLDFVIRAFGSHWSRLSMELPKVHDVRLFKLVLDIAGVEGHAGHRVLYDHFHGAGCYVEAMHIEEEYAKAKQQ